MDWRAAFKGNFITAVEFGGKEPTLTISNVKIVEVDDEKTKKMKPKLVVFFKEIERGWIPCKTNGMCLAGLLGSNETDNWSGHKVTLYSTKVQFGAEKVDGIRVRGSPELSAPVKVTVKLPKKKAQVMTLIPTGKPNGKAAPEPAEEAPPAEVLADAAEQAQDETEQEPAQSGENAF